MLFRGSANYDAIRARIRETSEEEGGGEEEGGSGVRQYQKCIEEAIVEDYCRPECL